jgi:hypothetical protein
MSIIVTDWSPPPFTPETFNKVDDEGKADVLMPADYSSRSSSGSRRY